MHLFVFVVSDYPFFNLHYDPFPNYILEWAVNIFSIFSEICKFNCWYFWQGFSLLNEQSVLMIPETIFSLCAGFSSPVINSADTSQLFGECKNLSKVCFCLAVS